jgi:hypothetical protein
LHCRMPCLACWYLGKQLQTPIPSSRRYLYFSRIYPHLHWNYRAWWTLGNNLIPQAAVAKRNKPLYTVDEDRVWQWADGVVEKQLPRVAIIDSLTATLYYTGRHQAKSDRCTLALQRRQSASGRTVVVGNWIEYRWIFVYVYVIVFVIVFRLLPLGPHLNSSKASPFAAWSHMVRAH